MFIIKTRESTVNENGNKIQFGIRKNATNKNIERIRNFFHDRIIKNNQIITADEGIYTWILKKNGNLYAAKTISKQELGTLHVNLDMLTKLNNEASGENNTVYAAGEFRITKTNYGNTRIDFNLLSGTYMVKLFKNKTFAQQITLRNNIVQRFKELFSSFGIDSNFLECNIETCSDEEKIGGMKLIESTNIRTSAANIALFNSMFERKIGGKYMTYNRHNRSTRRTQRNQLNRSKTYKL